jgi:hypothetical protein
MAHKADDEEACFQLFDQPDDAVDDVAGDEMDLDRRPGPFRLCLCRIDDRGEAVVASTVSSATSSMLAGKRGSSSTVTM